jgi:FAD/FMN-containing dehydrogenase
MRFTIISRPANLSGIWLIITRFFYPLDSVKNWNRIYGKRGLIQFQCVIPRADGKQVMEKILRAIVASGRASFLAVLKEFGDLPSVGMLSFPRPGITLALDFPCTPETIRLSRVLEEVVNDAGGALYPAKDALMQAESFQSYYPAWRDFAKYMDPRFSSSLWRRVSGSPV